MTDVTLAEAQRGLEGLVQRAATTGERVTITTGNQQAAVLVSAEELADLDEALALARYRARQAADPPVGGIPHDEVRARLGLPRQ